MPVIAPVHAHMELYKRLAEAVGVTVPFERLVIELDVCGPVRVYVKVTVDVKAAEAMVGAFEAYRVVAVAVNDDTTVDFVSAVSPVADAPAVVEAPR